MYDGNVGGARAGLGTTRPYPGGAAGPAVDPLAPAPLPAEAPAPAPAQGDADLITHPDYAQLSAPDDAALAEDLALLAWFAAGGAEDVPEAPADPREAADAR